MRLLPLLAVLLVATPGCLDVLQGSPARSSWAYAMTGIDDLQDEGLTGRGVRVAIVDTGIDLSHPALEDVRVVAWRDVTDGRADPYDPVGHGSHVASLLVARGSLRGGAPGVELVVAKVFDGESASDDGRVAQGIDFAIAQGADIIGLSLGGGTLPILGTRAEDAVRDAVARGIVVVAAAGNSGPDNGDVNSPANVADAIAVASVGRERRVSDFSNRGATGGGLLGLEARQRPDQKPEVSAPGEDLVGAWKDGQYVKASGTSQAVPFVVAALALAFQSVPGADPTNAAGVDRVKQAIAESARPLAGATTPHDRASGYGLLDAVALRGALR